MSKSIESNPDHDYFFVCRESEHDILEFWERREADLSAESSIKPKTGHRSIFYDGPRHLPRVCPMHGHLVGSILKDVVPRYFHHARTLRPKALWFGTVADSSIEHEIDKSLGMSSSEAVEVWRQGLQRRVPLNYFSIHAKWR